MNNVNGDGSDKSDDDGPPPLAPVDPEVEGERLKEQGNGAFKAKRYGEAVDLYTKAISEYHLLTGYTVWCGDSHHGAPGLLDATCTGTRVRITMTRRTSQPWIIVTHCVIHS